MTSGKLIVLYGVNNLGKSTQARQLVDSLRALGHHATYLKYPLYDTAPSGPLLNDYLRGGNPYGLSAREAQFVYILNRTQYQPELENILATGTHVIAEDYIGTGIAWGAAAQVDKTLLLQMNSHLRAPDIAILFEGARFSSGIETNHLHEADTIFTEHTALELRTLADEQGWYRIQAHGDQKDIQKKICDIVLPHIAAPHTQH
jgi:thymidylate kinase